MAVRGDVDSVVSEGCIRELLEVFCRASYKARNSLDRRVSYVWPVSRAAGAVRIL